MYICFILKQGENHGSLGIRQTKINWYTTLPIMKDKITLSVLTELVIIIELQRFLNCAKLLQESSFKFKNDERNCRIELLLKIL